MKIGSVDVGTNSVRLLLATVEDGHFTKRQKTLEMTRIGKGVDATGILDPSRVQATLDAIATYLKRLEATETEVFGIMATSAVRDAENRELFLEGARERFGVEIDVLTGEEEAAYGYAGVVGGLFAPGRTLVIDIGGGSTELILGSGPEPEHTVSINVGAVRMTDLYGRDEHLDEQALGQHLDAAFADILDELSDQTIDTVVGIGGTATTMGAIDQAMTVYDAQVIHGLRLPAERVGRIARNLADASLAERYALPGLERKRADIMPAGGLILHYLLTKVGVSELVLSDYDNLEGYILNRLLPKGETP